jgi:hypothetical protein
MSQQPETLHPGTYINPDTGVIIAVRGGPPKPKPPPVVVLAAQAMQPASPTGTHWDQGLYRDAMLDMAALAIGVLQYPTDAMMAAFHDATPTEFANAIRIALGLS